jgi:hypothetical protein
MLFCETRDKHLTKDISQTDYTATSRVEEFNILTCSQALTRNNAPVNGHVLWNGAILRQAEWIYHA